MNVKWIVATLGGAPAVADGLGMPAGEVGARTVRMWCMRGRLSAEWFADLAALAKSKGHPEIDEKALAEMARHWRLNRPPPKSRRAA